MQARVNRISKAGRGRERRWEEEGENTGKEDKEREGEERAHITYPLIAFSL